MYYEDEDVEEDLADLLSNIEVEDDCDYDIDFEPGEMSILYQTCAL